MLQISTNMEVNVEKLIHEVQLRPVIWDMDNPDYSNKVKRQECWDDLIETFSDEKMTNEEKKILEEMLRLKWKNIRDRYARDWQEVTFKKNNFGGKKRSPYIYTRQLEFLRNMMQSRKSWKTFSNHRKDRLEEDKPEEPTAGTSREVTSTVKRKRVSSLEGKGNQGSNNSLSIHSTSVGQKRLMEENPSTPTFKDNSSHDTQPSNKKRQLNAVEEKIIQALDDNLKRRQLRDSQDEDDDRQFLLSLLPTLKCIPTHSKFNVRIDIMEAINKYLTHLPEEPIHETNHTRAIKREDPLIDIDIEEEKLIDSFMQTSASNSGSHSSHISELDGEEDSKMSVFE